MSNWKSKYLKYKLKYLKLINQKGGMNDDLKKRAIPPRLKKYYQLPDHLREIIARDTMNKIARDTYPDKKQEILNEITDYFHYLFSEDEEGATLENLMMTLNIEWNDIEKIEEASVEDINRNLLQNKENIIENIQDLTDDY